MNTNPERPERVVVAILTNGEENASTHCTSPDIAACIRHQRENDNWQFLFLGANQDATATAARMNMNIGPAARLQRGRAPKSAESCHPWAYCPSQLSTSTEPRSEERGVATGPMPTVHQSLGGISPPSHGGIWQSKQTPGSMKPHA